MKPKLEILEMLDRHDTEIAALRKKCKHPKRLIRVRKVPTSGGCLLLGRFVICRNCGKQKVMWLSYGELKRKVVIQKTLRRQPGIHDQRLDSQMQYRREVE